MSDLFDESADDYSETGPSAADVESATRGCFAVVVMLGIIALLLGCFLLVVWL